MMTIEDIKALIAADESRTLELKKSTGELKDGMHAACAFLNTEGGWLIFGITPKSLKIVGQQVTDDTQREIALALAGIEPAYHIQPDYIPVPEYPGNKLIVFHFNGWKWGERPYTYRGRPYYKVESTTKIMPRDMYDDRLRAYQPQSYCWESVPAHGISMSDLNRDRILGCIRLGVEGGRIPESALSAPIEDTLAKWKLTVNGVPTNGAAMLFSNNIYPYDNFLLRLARFRGNNKLEFIDNKRAEGNFFDLLDAGMAFFFKHLNLSGRITDKSLMREERLEVPVRALREALINALCHRQWEKQNLTISIAVYDDRVEIANPGVFPPQIPIENIKDSHESFPYNRNMAQALYRSTFLESWGSGIQRIIEACQEQGAEEPTWRWDGAFVYVTFKRPSKDSTDTPKVNLEGNVAPSTIESKGGSSPEMEKVHQKSGSGSPESSLEPIISSPEFINSSSEQKVIALLRMDNKLTLERMAQYLKLTKRGVQKITNRLQEAGQLSRQGSTKAGEWIVND